MLVEKQEAPWGVFVGDPSPLALDNILVTSSLVCCFGNTWCRICILFLGLDFCVICALLNMNTSILY